MCWNKTISLNTFLFSVFTIGLLYLNKNTKYDIIKSKSDYIYLFFLSICTMQLVEYFLWISIETKNTRLNTIFSVIGFILLMIQPILALQLMPNEYTKQVTILFVISLILSILYKVLYNPFVFKTIVTNGHLNWLWTTYDGIEKIFMIIWLIAVCWSSFFTSDKTKIIFALGILIFSLYNYYKYNTWASMWCWILNGVFLYYIVQLLIIAPYKDLKGLC
jgi:hypothetical protein